MKNKITKLFLALLGLVFIHSNAQEAGQPMPDYVRKATNIEFLNNFAREKQQAYDINYAKAVEIAKKEGKPISGEKDGKVFALAGYNEATGKLIYKSIFTNTTVNNNTYFNNTPTKSSLRTANAKPLQANGIIGTGMLVGVWDGGAGLANHLAFTGGRYIHKNSPNTNAHPIGIAHAAHVAGTVGAANFGDGTAKGFAYGATIHAYNGLQAYDLPPMTAAATALVNPMYVSNHSYGINYLKSPGVTSAIFGQYNSDARDYDLLANNAQYYTMVFAAGNDRGDAGIPQKAGGKDLLSQGGVSKNLVVVAATRGTEDFSGITGVTSVSSVGGVGPFIASYSNYGPTDDFRIKPDIAAKGGEAISGEQVISVGTANVGATEAMQGTSMAAPAVTGVFTMWQGYHQTLFGKYMKSASVRALMAHTAREAGPAAGPDFMFGWGLIDAAKGVEVMDQAQAQTALFREFELPQGSTFEYEFSYDGVNPLIATIAWNDPAGTVTSQADLNLKKLVNDLDLRLVNVDNDQVYFPWSLTQSWAIAPTANNISVRNVDNARDNIEKIEPQNAVAGNYKVVVTHKGTLSGVKQDYSLIISGAGGQMPNTDGSVSVEDLVLNGLKVYPNPVKDFLQISGDLPVLTGAQTQIFDMSGRKIKDVNLNFDSNTTQLNVSELNAGTYLLIISKNGAKQSYKFIKN